MQERSFESALDLLLPRLQGVAGFEEAAFRRSLSEPSLTTVRLNPGKPAEAFRDGASVPWCNEGRYLPVRPVFTLDPLLHAGAYYVQEASSMFLDFLLRAHLPQRQNLRVLDLCGAPGGKSTLITSLLSKDDLLIANEPIRSRSGILEENLTRWGYANTWVCSNDPRDFGRLPGYFDVMVVDAPCSGTGLWRKDPDAANEYSTDAVALCSARQKRILADAWSALKEGGLLIYATCAYDPAEDEDVLDWISANLGAEGLFVPVPDAWGITVSRSREEQIAGYRFWPHRAQGEGLFIAALQKTSDTPQHFYKPFRLPRDKAAHAAVQTLLQHPEEFVAVADPRRIYHAIRARHEPDFTVLTEVLNFRKTGIQLGQGKGKEWLPAHDVALAIDRSPHLPTLNLEKGDALRFLKKESPAAADVPKGWQIAAYQGLGLGWVKGLTGRSNNYLPRNLRIRMDI